MCIMSHVLLLTGVVYDKEQAVIIIETVNSI